MSGGGAQRTRPAEGGEQAEVRRSWWPGWIWAVPIAAAIIVAWLGFRAFSHQGIEVTLITDNADGIKENQTQVTLHGFKIGEVNSLSLGKDGRQIKISVNIMADLQDRLRTGTRFWRAGGKPSLTDLSSLKSAISGPDIAMMPGSGKPATQFRLYDNMQDAQAGPMGPGLAYRVFFKGAVGELKAGDPVTLKGFTVGKITGFSLDFDAATGQLTTPVTIALQPRRFTIRNGQPPQNGNWRPEMNAMLARLIGEGLRAQLTQQPPLIGSETVTLAMMPGAGPARFDTGVAVPTIPSAEPRGIGDLVQKAGKLPIGEIGANVLQITAHLRTLTASPEIKQSLDHLEHALAGIDKAVKTAGPQIAPLVKRLRNAAAQIDATAQAADSIVGGYAQSQHGLKSTLAELTRAARAIRSLADYLDRHPEALIKGR